MNDMQQVKTEEDFNHLLAAAIDRANASRQAASG